MGGLARQTDRQTGRERQTDRQTDNHPPRRQTDIPDDFWKTSDPKSIFTLRGTMVPRLRSRLPPLFVILSWTLFFWRVEQRRPGITW